MEVRQEELTVLNFSVDVDKAGLFCTRNTKSTLYYHILLVILKGSVVQTVNQMMGRSCQTEMMDPFPCCQYVF